MKPMTKAEKVREGVGAPRRAHYVGRDKPHADGGGLCSPGRWPKASRRLPAGFAVELLDQARRGCQAVVMEASGGTDGVLDFMVKLSLGRMSEPPFPERHLAELREWIANRLNLRPEQCEVDEGQVMCLGMLSAVLKELQDPDSRFIEEIGSRVMLGVDVELPRTPAVFEEKVRWNLDDPDDKMASVSENYGTVEEKLTEVRKLVEEERSLDGLMSNKESCCEKLYITSLAVATEKDKIRLVHDATNKVQVNNRIRVRDRARSPGAEELRTLPREWQERRGGTKMFAVIGDASKAQEDQGEEGGLGVPSLPTGTGPGDRDLRVGFCQLLAVSG